MITKFDPDKILKTRDVYTVSEKLSALALEFAVSGELDTARDLVGLLNVHNPCYHRHRENLPPLWFAWDITSWPTGEKERVKESLDDMAKEKSENSWPEDVPKEDRTYDFQGLQKLKEKLQAVKERETPGFDLISPLLAKMLEVALVIDENDRDSVDRSDMKVLQEGLLGDIAKRLHAPHQMISVAQMRNVWPVLKTGALFRAAGIDAEEEKDVGRLAVKTFQQRFEDGPSKSSLWNRSIKELLRIISENTVTNKGAHEFWDEMGLDGRPTTLLHDALPAEEISLLETRLEITLPQDYKDFLSFSNGLDNSWNGIFLDPPLFEASKINWTEETGTADIINIEGLGIVNQKRDEDEHGWVWPDQGHVIKIGDEGIDYVYLIPPDTVKRLVLQYHDFLKESDENVKICVESVIKDFAGSMEEFEKLDWCAMTWAAGGAATQHTYPSFKAFLVEKAEDSSTVRYPGSY
jgi:hypothetical protein